MKKVVIRWAQVGIVATHRIKFKAWLHRLVIASILSALAEGNSYSYRTIASEYSAAAMTPR
jgi:hypothetical protein